MLIRSPVDRASLSSVLVGKRRAQFAIVVLFAAIMTPVPRAQNPSDNVDRDIDPAIAAAIATIPAIDNHAHPVLPPPNESTDRNFDALPVDHMEPDTDPVAWRPNNPQLTAAWKALWGFGKASPLDAEGMKGLNEARAKVKSREGPHYAQWCWIKPASQSC